MEGAGTVAVKPLAAKLVAGAAAANTSMKATSRRALRAYMNEDLA